ncbi:MAG: HAD family hydrolase [Erysipelotrichaceae bacterium]|nr:HAD family hydrolase [Erysipelotrichaceae bacterium]
MKKENIKLLALDIDGTILPHKKETVSKELKEGLKKAEELGIKILIATGRHFKFIPKLLLDDLKPDYLVTINGGCLVDKQGNILESHEIPVNTLERLIKECEKKDIGLGLKCKEDIVVYHNYDKYVEYYVGFDSPLAKLIIDDTKNKNYHLKHGLPLGLFLIEKDEVINSLIPLFPELTFAASHINGSDAFMNNTTKATTIESFIKKQNISWENVMSFGDAGNDLEMILKAKIGVAMGNSKDENLKEKADYITDTVENDGVLKALKHFEII